MTQEIILDTTKSFIRNNEKNLQLALQVEKAMSIVREELIKEFFECIEKQLKEKLETTEKWEIRATGTQGLWIRKNNWERLKVGKYSKDWWGIRLLPKGRGWAHASISVANIEKISDDQKKQISRKFYECIGSCQEGGPHIWQYFEDELEDFQSCEFLKKMITKEKQGEIVKDLTEKLAELAEAVDRVFSNSG